MDVRYVLVHSPVVGPASWQAVADHLSARGLVVSVPSMLGFDRGPAPLWERFVTIAAVGLPARSQPLVLVGHSGAGNLMPAIGQLLRPRIACCVFVDATLPTAGGQAPLVPTAFREELRSAAVDGRLPPWSDWFGPETSAALASDPRTRGILPELPRLPVAYVDETVPVPDDWPDAPCGYLQFSQSYEHEAADAAGRGWPVMRLAGDHLHLLSEPEEVAKRIVDLSAH